MSIAIPLRRRDGSVRAYAYVDDEDAALAGVRWSFDGKYASRRQDGRKVYLHREVAGCTRGDGFDVDHWDRDGLNNRRSNLRVASHALNGQNLPRGRGTSAHRGVCWHTRKAKWMAYTAVDGKRVHLGYFDDEEGAAAAAAQARARHMPFSEEAVAA